MELDTDMAGAGARILMVDDDPGIRDVVSDFLGKHGYKVETAADATEMERVLERGPVDLIVLDVMLPGEDGLAVCRRMTTTETAPPTIWRNPAIPGSCWRAFARSCGAPSSAAPRGSWARAASSRAGGWTWCA